MSGGLQSAGGIAGLLARTSMGLNIVGTGFANAFYHSDANGNVSALIYANGSIAATYKYDPCGRVLNKIGPLSDSNLYRFSTKEYQPLCDLIYYAYRYYDPNLQRWANRDVFGEIGAETSRHYQSHKNRFSFKPGELFAGPNLFSAMRNDFINVVDTDGRKDISVLGEPEFDVRDCTEDEWYQSNQSCKKDFGCFSHVLTCIAIKLGFNFVIFDAGVWIVVHTCDQEFVDPTPLPPDMA